MAAAELEDYGLAVGRPRRSNFTAHLGLRFGGMESASFCPKPPVAKAAGDLIHGTVLNDNQPPTPRPTRFCP